MRRDCCCASARLVLGSSVAVNQIEPSSSSGRNSEPSRVPSASGPTSNAAAVSTTARGRASARSSTGLYHPPPVAEQRHHGQRQDQRTDQRRGHRIGHRREHAAFLALQGEDRDMRGDDDHHREERRPPHFRCR
ncbi:hypothetical protein G6F40_016429 [Rhizopus arrhizus]|nr:hypothetical protein G6F40_016429 [Rhizopus arrhizus]